MASPDGGTEIASILVQARPDILDEVAASIERIGGAEIHNRDQRGKLVVVIIPSFGERYLSTALFAGLGE